MTDPIPLAWPTVAAVVACLCTCTFLIGRNRMTEYQDSRIEWVVDENARLRSALRDLYTAEGYEWPPDVEVPEPARKPSRWQRLVRYWPDFSAPATDDVPEVAPSSTTEAPSSTVPVEPEAPPEVPGPRTNPIGIPTQPDMKAASAVAPPADIDAIYEQALAAIRGEKR